MTVKRLENRAIGYDRVAGTIERMALPGRSRSCRCRDFWLETGPGGADFSVAQARGDERGGRSICATMRRRQPGCCSSATTDERRAADPENWQRGADGEAEHPPALTPVSRQIMDMSHTIWRSDAAAMPCIGSRLRIASVVFWRAPSLRRAAPARSITPCASASASSAYCAGRNTSA